MSGLTPTEGHDKAALRTLAKASRALAYRLHGEGAATRLADHAARLLERFPGAAISGFSAIGEEIDPAPLLARLNAIGHPLSLPAMQGKGKPLIFRSWRPGDEMAPAVWGIAEPLATRPAVEPDVLLVPLLAFDRDGYRLGYGGGFYDRSLERLRALKPVAAIGLAYDEQRLDAVPHHSYDQPLDWVVTPSGAFDCSRRPARDIET